MKKFALILLAFSLTIPAWCCGVRAISLPQVQRQIVNNTPPQQIVSVPVEQPAPEPLPEPETFEEFLKDVAGDFSVPGRDDAANAGQGGLENLPAEVAQLIDELGQSLTLPVFSGDSDESRIARNEKQVDIAENFAPKLQDELVSLFNGINNEINEFSSDQNQSVINGADSAVVDSFFDRVQNLHTTVLTDIVNAVRVEVGNTIKDVQTEQVPNGVFDQDGNEGFTVEQQTANEDAEITSENSNIRDIAAGQVLNTILGVDNAEQSLLSDFAFVRNSTLDTIRNQDEVSNQTSQINSNIDFDSALDSGFDTPTRQAIRFDILNPVFLPGGSRTFDRGTSSVVSLIRDLQSRFPGTALAEDLNFFLAVFPPATEQVVQGGLEPDDNTFINGDVTLNNLENTRFDSDDPNAVVNFDPNEDQFVTNSFTIGVGGQLVGLDPNVDNADQPIQRSSQVTRVLSDVSEFTGGQIADGKEAGFNSRTFGGSAGDFPSVEITVGDKTYQVYDHVFTSPIVLDLDQDGKIEASNGVWLPHTYKNGRIVEFDINGDGFMDLTEWVGKNDGLLIQYDSSKPVSGAQLFGDADGFINGYEKLRSLDANEDNVINGEELETLSVWQDKNQNAKVDAGEILSLEELKITQLSVEHESYVSNFVMDNKDVKMWDWWPSTFRVKKRTK